ncbi:MAG: hypothetical protein V4524_00035 [Patescibacteria group bacterium]
MNRHSLFSFIFVACLLALAYVSFGGVPVSAHEVYVLDASEIHSALQEPQPDFIQSIHDHLNQFMLWGSIVIALVLSVFFLSINRPLERVCDPWLLKLKKYSPHVAQVTLGLALIASGYYRAIFGVELPLSDIFGGFAVPFSYALIALGSMLVFGLFPRIAAICVSSIFAGLVWHFGIYMLNYATYFGEAITIVLFGGAHTLFADHRLAKLFTRVIPQHLYVYKFMIMRILFGASLIFASLYAKFVHGALALEVVSKYNLTHYFPFDPIFLVLGAMLIEILIGVCFIIGFEIRFASLFFLVFLSMSLVFFGESVWPHIILIGTAIAMFLHGYDRYTFSVQLERNKNEEPVL